MKLEDIEPFFATLKAANPQPASELEYTNVFELLAAVLLSAQATDAGVNKATRRLFPVANTPAKMLALGVDQVSEYIKTIGLYRTKAKNLVQTCRILVESHGGRVPRTREARPSSTDAAATTGLRPSRDMAAVTVGSIGADTGADVHGQSRRRSLAQRVSSWRELS